MTSDSQLMDSRDAVSYTHLDVYKRQAHGRSILPIFMDPDYNGNWDLEFDNVEGRCSVAVSYTHLDVYKRQPLRRRASPLPFALTRKRALSG